MKTRSEIKTDAKKALKGNVLNIFGISLIVSIIVYVLQKLPLLFGIAMVEANGTTTIFGKAVAMSKATTFANIWSIVIFFVTGVLTFVVAHYALNLLRGNKLSYGESFKAAGKQLGTIMLVVLLVDVLATLGYICFIIPGIIITFGLIQTTFVMIDNPEMGAVDVIKKSWELMKGHKFDFFVFILSFIGWGLLCIFVFPMIYVIPYMSLAFAAFYEELKKSVRE